MPFECPKCNTPVARDGQRFCYRCGQELNEYYESLKLNISPSEPATPASDAGSSSDPRSETAPTPAGTVILDPNAFDAPDKTPPSTPIKASLKILLPTGDVFDREITEAEVQIGKGPRNDIVIADPAVSAAHALIRVEDGVYKIDDLGSRNGTFIHSERVTGPRPLNHGDVIGIGLSKLTFRLGDHSDTTAIERRDLAAAKHAEPPPLTEESLALAVVTAGLATKANVERLQGEGKGRRLYHALIEEGLTTDEGLRDLVSRTFQIPVVDLNETPIDETVVAEFPAKLAREHQVFAVARTAEKTEAAETIVLAVADPTDREAAEHLRRELRSKPSIRLATAKQIREKVAHYYGPKLIGVLPSGEKLEYAIDKHEVELGKATHNHITLTDPTVSNTHAIVIAREAGYTIVDLGSRNGTFVNGERLGSQAHTLRHGDKVQLGQTVLTFRNPGETTANATAVLSGDALEEIRRRASATPSEVQKGDTEDSKKVPKVRSDQAAAPAELSPAGGTALAAALTPGQTTPDAVAPGGTATEAEKAEKKKKKKKKGGDDRLKAAYISGLSRIVAQVFAVLLSVGLALYLTYRNTDKPVIETNTKGKAKVKLSAPSAGIPFKGGPFEASGVVYVPGSNGVLIVDDGRPGEVLWMQLDEAGREVGQVKPIPLGVTVEDPEGITSDGNFFYIMGSQSAPNAGERNALVRFTFDAATQTVHQAEAMTNLRDFLIANVLELKDADKKGSDGGLNIEGIAWDFKRARWLLGLRSPLGKDDSAFVVAIKLKNPTGAFSVDNLAEPNAIPLKLGGLGIRDIQFDTEANSFMIIAGAPEHHEKSEFTLWEWTGSAEQSGSETALRREQNLDSKMKPEGITHVEIGGRKFTLIVGDSSSYIKLDYAE